MGAHHHDGHGHHEGHGHAEHLDRNEAARRGDRARLAAAASITAVIFLVELFGGWLSHSLALISDAGHMLSDVAAQGLSLVALLIAARPSNDRKTWGYYRIEIL